MIFIYVNMNTLISWQYEMILYTNTGPYCIKTQLYLAYTMNKNELFHRRNLMILLCFVSTSTKGKLCETSNDIFLPIEYYSLIVHQLCYFF